MSDAPGIMTGGTTREGDVAVARRFARFSTGYWKGQTLRPAALLTGGLAFFLLLKLVADVGVNRWNRWFFDALEKHDGRTAMMAAAAFLGLVLFIAAVGVGIVRTRETLQVRWRAWCTSALLDRWMARQRYYHMGASSTGLQNPEYRISDDVRFATEPLVDFAIGLFTALLSASAFFGILYAVGGSLDLEVLGARIHIPAYMVLGALLYGLCASALVPIVGRHLAGATAAKNEAEARFRFEMIHLRENAEPVALARAEGRARERLERTYAGLVRDWLRAVRQHGNVTWIMNGNAALIPVVPLAMTAPKYLSGAMTLGEVMQLASAFFQVQIAISWLVDNYWRVAEWHASARRIVELMDAFERVDPAGGSLGGQIEMGHSEDGCVHLVDLQLTDPVGRVVIGHADAVFRAGDSVWLTGMAGTGKSSLMRALAGLWRWGRGQILIPRGASVAVVPANAFMPAGTLADALAYPAASGAYDREVYAAALAASGLQSMEPSLEDASRWDRLLSASVRQRLAIARVLVTRPDVVVLEGALSSLDDASQVALLRMLQAHLPDAILISVGAGKELEPFHNRRLMLVWEDGGDPVLVERTVRLRSEQPNVIHLALGDRHA